MSDKPATSTPLSEPSLSSRAARTIFPVVALILMCGLSGMLATRLYILNPTQLRKLTFQRILTISIYVTAMMFIFASTIYLSDFSMPTYHNCHGSIELCISFFVVSKALIYLFLLERAASIRGKPRMRDPYWIAGILAIVFGFGTITVFTFLGPLVLLTRSRASPSSPQRPPTCEIGLPLKALIRLIGYDAFINLTLTALYLAMANRICHRLTWRNAFKLVLRALPFRNPGPLPSQADVFELFMAKSVIACLGTVSATVGNLGALIALHGHEQAWLCLTICSVDVSWAVMVIHWLTTNVFRDKPASTLTTRPRARQLAAAGEYHEMH